MQNLTKVSSSRETIFPKTYRALFVEISLSSEKVSIIESNFDNFDSEQKNSTYNYLKILSIENRNLERS